jgi:hypothetical protein
MGGRVGPKGRSGWLQKISRPPEFDPRTVQPTAGRYTDCATSAHETQYCHLKYQKYTYLYVILYMFK